MAVKVYQSRIYAQISLIFSLALQFSFRNANGIQSVVPLLSSSHDELRTTTVRFIGWLITKTKGLERSKNIFLFDLEFILKKKKN